MIVAFVMLNILAILLLNWFYQFKNVSWWVTWPCVRGYLDVGVMWNISGFDKLGTMWNVHAKVQDPLTFSCVADEAVCTEEYC